MSDNKRMKTALVSVFHKDGLDEIITTLHKEGVQLLSTGGTQEFIESLGVPCQRVEDLTGYPSILGGRVKTLHPKVFGGILGRRDNEGDQVQMVNYEIPEIDKMLDPKSPPGVQALAMKLAERMSRINGELHKEFLCIVSNMETDYYSAGVKSVIRNCLKAREKLTVSASHPN